MSLKSFDEDVENLEAGIPESKQRVDEQKTWLNILPKNIKTIADVGCGAGYHSKYFKELGMIPTAFDRLESAFKFHGEIEFIKADILDLPKDRQFDAVFCSHVLEHCPDPLTAILKMREIIADDGYLIIVVPPYEPVVVNYHWITGWNVTQLATFLVATGFDCREGVFSQFGIHVCGFGKKIRMEETKFNIEKTLKYLPLGIAKEYFMKDGHEFIDGQIAFADKSMSWRLGKTFTSSFPNFNFQTSLKLEYHEKKWMSIDKFLEIDQPLDFSVGQITIISLVQGNSSSVRMAIGNGKKNKPFENCSELWMSFEPGLNVRKHSVYDFKILRGDLDYSLINHMSFGGECENCLINAWIFDSLGKSIFH